MVIQMKVTNFLCNSFLCNDLLMLCRNQVTGFQSWVTDLMKLVLFMLVCTYFTEEIFGYMNKTPFR